MTVMVLKAFPVLAAIGTGHGVFRFCDEDRDKLSNLTAQVITGCCEVLQKPTIETMRAKDMVQVVGASGEESVFTDSAYWINPALMLKFVALYNEQKPITCETSIYSDFMTCQGTDVTRKTRLGNCHSNAFLSHVWKVMSEVPLLILALPESKFYHIGTMNEYLDTFCEDPQLQSELCFGKMVNCEILDGDSAIKSSGENNKGVILHSVIPVDLKVPSDTVVEFCRISSSRVLLNPRTILSFVEIPDDCQEDLPGEHVYHTVPINIANECLFVTVVFNICDDLKRHFGNVQSIRLGRLSVRQMFDDDTFENADIIPANNAATLWDAKLFRAAGTRSQSFLLSLSLLRGRRENFNGSRFSMADLMRLRDKEAIFQSYI